MKEIIFTDMIGVSDKYQPIPASKLIPSWYKEMQSYVTDKKLPNVAADNATNATVKKCMPVFDAMTSGYLIVLPSDVYVSQKNGAPYYEWSNHGIIEFHDPLQAPTHPQKNQMPVYPKFINAWSIKTPKGYSCLFTAPKHRDNPFTILDGIVDCDSYTGVVNFPFVLNDVTFEGLIPAGTPIVQVIPFKRDSFKMSFGTEKDKKSINNVMLTFRSIFHDKNKTLF